MRRRAVGAGFREDLLIRNETPRPVDLELRLDAGADFADLFEVRDAQPKKGESYQWAGEDRLLLGYRRGGFLRAAPHTVGPPAGIDERGVTVRLPIEPAR